MNFQNKKVLLIASEEDMASRRMKEAILKNHEYNKEYFNEEYEIYELTKNIKLASFKGSLLKLDYLDNYIEADFFIFLSKHKSQSEIPGIFIHPIGNFSNENPLGGFPNKLSYVSANFMKLIFINMLELEKLIKIKVGLEATHHGPFIEKVPSIFVEIGSSEREWNSIEIASLVVNKILEAIDLKTWFEYEPVVCFGGPHYAPAFIKYEMEETYALSHIISKYSLEKANLNEETLFEPIRKTMENVDKILIDWKGVDSEKRKIIAEFANKNGFELIRA